MKIIKMSLDNAIPEWAIKAGDKKCVLPVAADQMARIASLSDTLDETSLVIERDRIEKCASMNEAYCYNKKWNRDIIASLREYAIVCSMDMSKFIEVDPEDYRASNVKSEKLIQAEAQKEERIVQASSKITLDAFKIEEKLNQPDIKGDWEVVSKQSKLKYKPTLDSGSIKPLRGGEDYNTSSNRTVAQGQNSINKPDSIQKMIESEVEDNGARLKREKMEREQHKTARHQEWEQSKIKEMEKKEIVARGKVFPTEVMNAQSGLNTPSSSRGVFAKSDLSDIPEKTHGESIKDKNLEHKSSIQRENKGKHDFSLKSAGKAEISDIFGEELKKFMKK